LTRLARLVASGLGLGYAPIASGTVGTAGAIPLAWLVATAFADKPWAHLLFLLLAVAAAVVAADVAARDEGLADPSFVVVDEIVGYLVAVAFLPLTPAVVVVSFLLFRLFDVAKPPPIAQLERLRGGLGIVADDVAAGIATHVLLRVATGIGWL
jgi:phosphatidylglycerophosphatase A